MAEKSVCFVVSSRQVVAVKDTSWQWTKKEKGDLPANNGVRLKTAEFDVSQEILDDPDLPEMYLVDNAETPGSISKVE